GHALGGRADELDLSGMRRAQGRFRDGGDLNFRRRRGSNALHAVNFRGSRMSSINLTQHFLIAMPNMADPYFAKSLTYICEHNDHGALGIVVNRPIDMTLHALFAHLSLRLNDQAYADAPIYFGGPVQTDRGFVLPLPAGEWQSTIKGTAGKEGALRPATAEGHLAGG